MIIISDLRRSRLALLWTWVGCRLISRSKIVHYHAPSPSRRMDDGKLADFASLPE